MRQSCSLHSFGHTYDMGGGGALDYSDHHLCMSGIEGLSVTHWTGDYAPWQDGLALQDGFTHGQSHCTFGSTL